MNPTQYANYWVGVDLDGTLAIHDSDWETSVGAPIQVTVHRVKKLLDKGFRIKIFTARACEARQIPIVQDWCVKQGLVYHDGMPLEVTNVKDYSMIQLWDDRAVAIEHGTGKVLGGNMIGEDDGKIILVGEEE